MTYKKKLIEVALPLEAINAESTREKSIRYGHPSTLHFWWARRPLSAARAVLWASIVDDPSSHPDRFPTEESQNQERERLFDILRDLVLWKNVNNPSVLRKALKEIDNSSNGRLPEVFDPFAGGGSIPLEAQRLGLKAYASDLNPVAVLINKAMLEYPPKFVDRIPVNPEAKMQLDNHNQVNTWKGLAGLASDIQYYGEWIKKEAYRRIGYLYPRINLPSEQGGGEATVMAWIWARTVKCPNPACSLEMPLVKTFVISSKEESEVYVEPVLNQDKSVIYKVKQGKISNKGTVDRRGGKCPFCNEQVPLSYIRVEGKSSRIGSRMIAVVAESKSGRFYLSPDDAQEHAAQTSPATEYVKGKLINYPGYINPPAYGFQDISQLFTNRQMHVLSIFSSLIKEVVDIIRSDANESFDEIRGKSLSENGDGLLAYSEAIGVYLSFVVGKLADYNSAFCSWHNAKELIKHTFGLTGMAMTWDYVETNPFSNSSGCFTNMLDWVVKVVQKLPADTLPASVKQFDAQSDIGLRNVIISTDPPYYNNVTYAGFADFFYVWMRKSLASIYPKLFSTMLTPKEEELIADPYLRGSKKAASDYFESGMASVCRQIYQYANDDYPVTIYYAYKQSDNSLGDNGGSVGWETMLSAIISAGLSINGTWPIRTEMTTRTRNNESNALASSIVLVCRKRQENAGICTRRDFINALHRELRPALIKLQSANIAPVDLAQSAIGPGIGVYSRYSSVLEADGTPMSVRSALQIINQQLDAYFNEQDGELDRESRFCVDLFSLSAYNDMRFGEADVLARAKSTSVQALAQRGVLSAAKGLVRLKTREELPEQLEQQESCIWLLTQQLAKSLENGGVKATASLVRGILGSNAEQAKALSYRLYTLCERKHWAQEGSAYNNLVNAWTDIQSMAARLNAETPEQMKLDV